MNRQLLAEGAEIISSYRMEFAGAGALMDTSTMKKTMNAKNVRFQDAANASWILKINTRMMDKV